MSESTDLKLALLNVYRCDVSDWCWPGVQVVVTRCESITWTTQWAIYLPRVVHHRLICWERMTSLCLLLIYYFWISNKNQNINCVLQLSSRQNQERRSWSWSFSSLMTVSSTLISRLQNQMHRRRHALICSNRPTGYSEPPWDARHRTLGSLK